MKKKAKKCFPGCRVQGIGSRVRFSSCDEPITYPDTLFALCGRMVVHALCNRKSLPHSGREFKTQIGLPIARQEPGDTIFGQDTNRYEIAFAIRERREGSSKYEASLR